MTSWEGLNRRKFPRVNYPCLVVIRKEDKNGVILTHTENVGIGGVSVVLKTDVKIYSTVDLELDLLDLGDHIKCVGKVVWNVQRKSGAKEKPLFYDIGIEYVDLKEDELKRIEKVVEMLVKNFEDKEPKE